MDKADMGITFNYMNNSKTMTLKNTNSEPVPQCLWELTL